jgi:hypothetical protein
MLDFVATVLLTAVMVVNVNAVVSAMPVTRAQRLSLALVVGLWIGFVAASASIGLPAIARPVPVIGLYFAIPLVATALLAAFSPAARAAMLGLPTPMLIGLNVSRVFGALFLLLAAAGRLGGPFPASAGWGDIVTGVVALPVAIMVVRGVAKSSRIPAWWNGFGALDLVVAVSLGIMSADGSPLQVFHAVTGPTPLTDLPYLFIPAVLVPFYLIVHAVLFVQLRRAAEPGGIDGRVAGQPA